MRNKTSKYPAKIPTSNFPARNLGLNARLARSLRSHLPARLRDLLGKTLSRLIIF